VRFPSAPRDAPPAQGHSCLACMPGPPGIGRPDAGRGRAPGSPAGTAPVASSARPASAGALCRRPATGGPRYSACRRARRAWPPPPRVPRARPPLLLAAPQATAGPGQCRPHSQGSTREHPSPQAWRQAPTPRRRPRPAAASRGAAAARARRPPALRCWAARALAAAAPAPRLSTCGPAAATSAQLLRRLPCRALRAQAAAAATATLMEQPARPRATGASAGLLRRML